MSAGDRKGSTAGPGSAGGAEAAATPWPVWVALALAGVATALFAWRTVYPPRRSRHPLPVEKPSGAFHRVQAVLGPLALRMEDGSVVTLAGVVAPQDAAQAARVTARIEALAPPGTRVYVEVEPVRSGGAPATFASVYLPPPGASPSRPFPYGDSQLLNATLVQEGFARADLAQLYRYTNEFEMIENDARRNQRGIWKPPPAREPPSVDPSE